MATKEEAIIALQNTHARLKNIKDRSALVGPSELYRKAYAAFDAGDFDSTVKICNDTALLVDSQEEPPQPQAQPQQEIVEDDPYGDPYGSDIADEEVVDEPQEEEVIDVQEEVSDVQDDEVIDVQDEEVIDVQEEEVSDVQEEEVIDVQDDEVIDVQDDEVIEEEPQEEEVIDVQDEEVMEEEGQDDTPAQQGPATHADAAKALTDLYEELKEAPKYLKISPLIKEYNNARQIFDSKNFDYVIQETNRISELLNGMIEDYNLLTLDLMKSQDQLKEAQQTGLQMDYMTLTQLLEDCAKLLKGGEVAGAKQRYNDFSGLFDQQINTSLAPIRNDAMRILQGVSNMIEQAQWDNLNTTKAEERYAEIRDGVEKARSFEEFQQLVEQTEDIKELLEFAKQEKALKAEKPKKISAEIQKARLELINLKKMNMDIDQLIDVFDNVSNMFTNVEDDDEFDRLEKQLGKLNKMIDTKKASLDEILGEREEINTDIEQKRQIIAELTHNGYLMAAMTNKLDKAVDKLNKEATKDAIKVCKRFLSNYSAELESIKAQNKDEFNLRIRLLSDFEELSDLYDKLEDDLDDVMEFLVMFSQEFSEASSLDDFREMNRKMRESIRAVKTELGMEIDEEEEDLLDQFEEIEESPDWEEDEPTEASAEPEAAQTPEEDPQDATAEGGSTDEPPASQAGSGLPPPPDD